MLVAKCLICGTEYSGEKYEDLCESNGITPGEMDDPMKEKLVTNLQDKVLICPICDSQIEDLYLKP